MPSPKGSGKSSPRSSSLPFKAKTYKLDSLSTRKEIVRALATDVVFDHWKATMNLNCIPAFHEYHRHSKTITKHHEDACAEINKERDTAGILHKEFVSYQRIIQRYMQSDSEQYKYLRALDSKFATLIQLLDTILDRLEDLLAIEGMLYADNPNRENLPTAFCKTLETARSFGANLWGGMLHYHAYLKNHRLEDDGRYGKLKDPPPLKQKKTFKKTVSKFPKKLARKVSGF